jgi:hypothetical protein
MYLLWIVGFFFMFLMTGFNQDLSNNQLATDGMYDAIAKQMLTYHVSAIRKCHATACPAGNVDPSAYLPSFVGNAATTTYATNSKFRTVSDGAGHIVTVYMPIYTATGGTMSGSTQADAKLATALTKANHGDSSVGLYDLATGYLQYSHDYGSVKGVAVSSGFGGLTLRNNMPIAYGVYQ